MLRSWRLRLLTVGLPAVLAGSFELLRARLQPLSAMPEAAGVLITAGLALIGALVYLQTVYALVSRLAADAETGRAEAEMAALRRGVADALHDSISQTLFFLHVRLQRAAARARSLGDGALSAELAEAALATEDGYLEVRDAILRLGRTEPGGAEELPAADSVAPLVETALEGSGLGVRVEEAEGALAHLSPRALAALRAIVLESVRNVRKHASAHAVTVTVGTDERGGFARVEDDGRGFSPEAAGYGLQAARRRAEASAFDLRVDSAPGRGTRVEVRWRSGGGGSGVPHADRG